ncbi:hypothetical protein BDN70DRAFT_883743 [Pholiota conissans]|uniref:F-box domain-containing protein n=1 Tax=Pholiota conissans TaxID=109636 RepID=A0A9P5YVP0_9AGAR|nr:hypothetical protein BDN70DRAFT_883743 [Pholiota conissans]
MQEQGSSALQPNYASAEKDVTPLPNAVFGDLPTEILIDIFTHMDWKDILNCRKVSKRLSQISTAQSLWMFTFQRLSTELLAPPILERPLHAYTAKELEQIIFRRISSELAFAVNQAPRTQPFDCPKVSFMRDDNFRLLQGGRWLLVTSPHPDMLPGCVYVFDLDKPFPQDLHYIIDTGDRTPKTRWLIAADIDKDAPSLTFNVCLVPGSTIRSFSRDPAGPEFDSDIHPNTYMHDASVNIHVYRLTLNGCGSDAILEAHKLRTIYAGLQLFTGDNLILCGHYLVRYIYDARYTKRRIEVCNWFLSNSSYSKSYINSTGLKRPSFTLIRDGRLLIINENRISLYELSMHPGKIVANAMLQPYWYREGARNFDRSSRISKAYPDLRTNTTRVAVALSDRIYGMLIPNDTSDPWFGQLCASDLVASPTIYLGINKTFDQRQRERKTTTFIWPCDKDEQDGSLLIPTAERLLVYPDKLPCSFGPPLLDEHSNRVFFAGSYIWYIIDYAFN